MNLHLLEKQLHKFISDEDYSLHDTLRNYNIQLTVVYDLQYSIFGFVYYSRLGNYHLLINGNLDLDTQRKTFIHEIKHIVIDMPKIGYIVGLDMQRTKLETETDKIAESIALYG